MGQMYLSIVEVYFAFDVMQDFCITLMNNTPPNSISVDNIHYVSQY